MMVNRREWKYGSWKGMEVWKMEDNGSMEGGREWKYGRWKIMEVWLVELKNKKRMKDI